MERGEFARLAEAAVLAEDLHAVVGTGLPNCGDAGRAGSYGGSFSLTGFLP